jgi:4-amino-4-deoxy-L-arabinose transferase-like glycosyltransferase
MPAAPQSTISPQSTRRNRIGPGLLASLLLVGAVALGLGTRELWNPVEPRYAGVAAHLSDGGPWMVPEYQGKAYDQKPPLAFWTVAGLHSIFKVDRSLFLTRLPSACGLLLACLGLARLTRRFFGERAALIAALVLGTAVLPVWSARFFHLDTLFCASLVWTLEASWAHREAREGPGSTGASLVLGALAVTLGFFLKGPGAAVMALLVLGATALWLRDRSVVGRSGLLGMIAIAAILFAAWLIPAARSAGHEWLRELFVEQGVLRLASKAPPKKHGPLYYLAALATTLAPWSLVLPFALFAAGRSLSRRLGKKLRGPERQGLVLAICWLVVVTLVLSFGVTKRSRYLLLALPGAAMLIAWLLTRAGGSATSREDAGDAASSEELPESTRFALGLCAGLAGLLALAFAALVFFGPQIAAALALKPEIVLTADLVRQDATGRLLAGLAFGLVGFCVLAARVSSRHRAPWALASVLVLGWSLWGLSVAPALDRQRGEREFLETLRPLLAEGRELWAVGHAGHRESSWGWFWYYTGHAVRVDDERHEALAAAAQDHPVVVLWDGRFSDTGGRHPVPRSFRRLNRQRMSRQGYFIYVGGPDE